MANSAFAFCVRKADSLGGARNGVLVTPHGAVETPAFMPVGTQATVKGVTACQLRATGSPMILANTYHLALRPGPDVVQALGGLHQMMDWDGPILTDSGGFQVFSLKSRIQIDDQAVVFQSHIDGQRVRFDPERVVRLQQLLGSDIAMVLDHVVPLPSDAETIAMACRRSVHWAQRSKAVPQRTEQALFAIVQGGLDADLRRWCAEQLVSLGFDGYAIGGLSVGERPDQMYAVLEATCPHLPADQPRYLMGVGRPEDILEAVDRGVDLFDCVMPTRNGRNALAFTDQGPIRIRNALYRSDPEPLELDCPCVACRHGRGYLRHLFMTREMLGPILLTIHNLTYYQRLMAAAREAIAADRFADFKSEKLAGWSGDRAAQ